MAHVPAPHDPQEGGEGPPLLATVPSVRVGWRVIQQTVAQLGELDEHGHIEARALARRVIGAPEQARLFDDGSEHLTMPVRLKGIRVERSRQFGAVYLVLALWRGTGLEELRERLLAAGKERVAWRGWRACWLRRGSASHRASCTLPRIGTDARRSAVHCNSG
ncbi:hypothetical protein [Microvirga massiliensis]|uniref:hypothetical protein n=1 Tax=Microvirga massiliensis TaxID=1033741 RepID=UPI000A817B34|nr:hypothetical protein [Microvirga massiliensis]